MFRDSFRVPCIRDGTDDICAAHQSIVAKRFPAEGNRADFVFQIAVVGQLLYGTVVCTVRCCLVQIYLSKRD